MENSDTAVVEYFFGRTVKPSETSTIGLMFRELAITNISLKSLTKGNSIVKGLIDGQEFVIATLSENCPSTRVDLKFNRECMFISFEVTGDAEVDIIGYVTGVDQSKMMSLKDAMELSDTSDDDDYKDGEEGEEEEIDNMLEKEEDEIVEQEEESEEEEEKEGEEKEDERRDAVSFLVPDYKHMGKFIKYQDILVGDGPLPTKGHRVQISYKLTLPTGEVLDSDNLNDITRCPFDTEFRVGLGHVVGGVDRAIQTMRVGGVRKIIVSPEMGFGDRGNIVSDIRSGEVFMVEVNLLGSQ